MHDFLAILLDLETVNNSYFAILIVLFPRAQVGMVESVSQ